MQAAKADTVRLMSQLEVGFLRIHRLMAAALRLHFDAGVWGPVRLGSWGLPWLDFKGCSIRELRSEHGMIVRSWPVYCSLVCRACGAYSGPKFDVKCDNHGNAADKATPVEPISSEQH